MRAESAEAAEERLKLKARKRGGWEAKKLWGLEACRLGSWDVRKVGGGEEVEGESGER